MVDGFRDSAVAQLLALSVFLVLNTPARAAIVYEQTWDNTAHPGVNGLNSNGPTSIPTSPFTSDQQGADHFNDLPQGTVIQGVYWHGSYLDGAVPGVSKAFRIRFWSESGGLPDSIIFEESVVSLGVDTGEDNPAGDSVMSYSAAITSAPALDAGTTYFLSVLENDASTNSVWTWAAAGDGLFSMWFRLGDGDPTWSSFNRNMAFALDTLPPPPPPGTIPLPASVLLLAGGLLGLRVSRAPDRAGPRRAG